MSSNAIFFEQWFLGEVELERIVRTQAYIEPESEEVREWIAFIGQEQRIVADRAHRDANLLEVEQILKRWHLPQEDSMRNGMRSEERRCEMIWVASLAAVRTQHERTLMAEMSS